MLRYVYFTTILKIEEKNSNKTNINIDNMNASLSILVSAKILI